MNHRVLGKANRVLLASLDAGDCVIIKTAHSRYRFWIEFPKLAIGVIDGGSFSSPIRVRISIEGAQRDEQPLEPGCHLRIDQLGPDGNPVRRLVTSSVISITLQHDRRAA